MRLLLFSSVAGDKKNLANYLKSGATVLGKSMRSISRETDQNSGLSHKTISSSFFNGLSMRNIELVMDSDLGANPRDLERSHDTIDDESIDLAIISDTEEIDESLTNERNSKVNADYISSEEEGDINQNRPRLAKPQGITSQDDEEADEDDDLDDDLDESSDDDEDDYGVDEVMYC